MLTEQRACKICGSGSVSPAKAGLPKTMWRIVCLLEKSKPRCERNEKLWTNGVAECWTAANDYSITPRLHHPSASRCGINMVRHLQAPPALMNSLIGNA